MASSAKVTSLLLNAMLITTSCVTHSVIAALTVINMTRLHAKQPPRTYSRLTLTKLRSELRPPVFAGVGLGWPFDRLGHSHTALSICCPPYRQCQSHCHRPHSFGWTQGGNPAEESSFRPVSDLYLLHGCRLPEAPAT